MKAVALAIALVSLSFATPVHAAFTKGDVVLANFGSADIYHINPTGTILGAYGTGTRFWQGPALTPQGNVVVAFQQDANFRAGFHVLSPTGTTITTATPFQLYAPMDVGVLGNGTLVFADRLPAVQLFSPTGFFYRTITSPTLLNPRGIAADNGNTFWVTATGALFHYQEDGTLLSSLNVDFNPRDLIVDRNDATLWVTTSAAKVYHLARDGAVLGSFNLPGVTESNGIDMALDGNLLVTGANSSFIYTYSQTGTLLSSVSIGYNKLPSGLLVVAPEPVSASILAVGAASLLMRRRRSSGSQPG